MSGFLDFLASRQSKVNEGLVDAKFMVIFEKGRYSNFKKSVVPHLDDEFDKFDEKEFTEFVYTHVLNIDLPEALKHIFKDLDFELGGMSPKIVFLRCKKADINIIIQY